MQLERKAVDKGIKTISLDVIDTNPRARMLYRKLGFVENQTRSLRPLDWFVRFPFKSATLMTKQMD